MARRSDFAARLEHARLELKYSQADAAARIPVSLKTYTRWERDQGGPPTAAFVPAISEALGIERAELAQLIERRARNLRRNRPRRNGPNGAAGAGAALATTAAVLALMFGVLGVCPVCVAHELVAQTNTAAASAEAVLD